MWGIFDTHTYMYFLYDFLLRNRYRVIIDNQPSCTCSSTSQHECFCVHITYVFTRVSLVIYSDYARTTFFLLTKRRVYYCYHYILFSSQTVTCARARANSFGCIAKVLLVPPHDVVLRQRAILNAELHAVYSRRAVREQVRTHTNTHTRTNEQTKIVWWLLYIFCYVV